MKPEEAPDSLRERLASALNTVVFDMDASRGLADAVLPVVKSERERAEAAEHLLEHWADEHIVLRAMDGSQVHADWCYLCRLERAEVAVQQVRDVAERIRADLAQADEATTPEHVWYGYVALDDVRALVATVLDQPEGTPAARCPSCDHLTEIHQPDGCWHTVTVGTVGRDLVCPCSAPRAAPEPPEES